MVLLFTFGGNEVRDDKSASELANTIADHRTVIGSELSKVIIVTGKRWSDILPEEERKKDAKDEDPKNKAEMVRDKLSERGIKDVIIKQVDHTNFKECLLEITDMCRSCQNEGNEVILNVSGGTKEISFGAINAAWMLGLRAFHLQYRGKSKIVELPVPTVKYLTKMSDEMKEYLVVLLIGKNKIMTSNSIQNVRGIGGPTLSDAMNILISDGLVYKDDYKVRSELSGRIQTRKRKIYMLKDVGEWYAILAKKEFESTAQGKEKLHKMENEIKTIKTRT